MQAIYNLIQKSLTQTRCLAKWRTVRVSFGKEYQKCKKNSCSLEIDAAIEDVGNTGPFTNIAKSK